VGAKDAAGAWLDGSKDNKLTVPANVPAKQFWSLDREKAQTE
jgi:hypothetical protein